MTGYFTISPNVCFCTTWEEPNQRNMHWNKQKYVKSIPNIIDCDLKKEQKILVIFGTNIFNTTAHQTIFLVFTLPSVCFCTTWENQNKRYVHCNEQKNFNKFYIFGPVVPNSQSITRFDSHAALCQPDDLQECWDCWSLDWSKAEHHWHCCQRQEKPSLCGCACGHVMCWHFEHFYCRQLKNGKLDELSTQVTEMWKMCFMSYFD